MRAVQRLVKNGNSWMVTIPRPVLFFIGWRPGDSLEMVVNPDRSITVYRVVSVRVDGVDAAPVLPLELEPMK